MARNGFSFIDSDLHICEPVDLWRDYIDPRYKDQAPVGTETTGLFSEMNLLHLGRLIHPHDVTKAKPCGADNCLLLMGNAMTSYILRVFGLRNAALPPPPTPLTTEAQSFI